MVGQACEPMAVGRVGTPPSCCVWLAERARWRPYWDGHPNEDVWDDPMGNAVRYESMDDWDPHHRPRNGGWWAASDVGPLTVSVPHTCAWVSRDGAGRARTMRRLGKRCAQ